MNAVESMMDIEQLRTSIIDQSVETAIAQVHQWINEHGLAMIKANQGLPYNFQEAEEIRKAHEKVELKCMKFLSFYAQMNMRYIPEEIESMRQSMDIAIHNFSERVKARRHVVVSFFTFYRHINELQDIFSNVRDGDHIRLPNTVADVYKFIEKHHNKTKTCLKKFSHLKDEAIRIQTSLDTLLKLDSENNFESVDPKDVKKVSKHIDDLLRITETELLAWYESQSLLEIEIKIEAKMMLIEDEIVRSSAWLRDIAQLFIERYANNVVGKSTVENNILQNDNDQLVKKLESAHEYGWRLKHIYKNLSDQFERDTDRGEVSDAKFNELWNLAELVSSESTDRLKIAGNLFTSLDTTLDNVEDLLLSVNRDKQSIEKRDEILQQYQERVNDIHEDFRGIKTVANALLKKLQFDLQNKKVYSDNVSHFEIEQTEDMIKMKIFTLGVKIKALDRCLYEDQTQGIVVTRAPRERSASEITDYDNSEYLNILKKYIAFLKNSSLKWESQVLPKNFDQAKKAIDAHQKLAGQADQYWKDVQKALSEYFDRLERQNEDKDISALISEAEQKKKQWLKKWNEHLKLKLDPRFNILLKMRNFNNGLAKDLNTLDEFVTRPNHNLPVVKELRKDLEKMWDNPKSEVLETLTYEAHEVHVSDFNDQLASLESKVESFNNRIGLFLELERMIQSILEFLPKLNIFKKEWHGRVNMHRDNPSELADLEREAKQIYSRIDQFNIDRLRKLATAIYGSSKRIEWLIDELIVDFSIPKSHKTVSEQSVVAEEKVVPVFSERNQREMNEEPDYTSESKKKLLLVNAELDSKTKLDFAIDSLPRIEGDQYDIQWYKGDEPIDVHMDSRYVVKVDKKSGQINMDIDHCQESDAGRYWCELRSDSWGVRTSSPVLLSVYSSKKPGKISPQFSEKTYAPLNESFSFKLNLDGFKYVPESEIFFNKSQVNVSHSKCPWSRVSSNEVLEFKNHSITRNDAGQYEFIVSGQTVAQTHLEIGEKPKFEYHEYVEKFRLGESAKVVIPIKNYNSISLKNIVWKRKQIPLKSDDVNYKTYISNAGELVLEMPEFSSGDVGQYTCQVSNQYGEDSMKLSLEASDIESPSTVTPVESLINEHVVVNMGDSVNMDLYFQPGIKGDVLWSKDGKPIRKSDTHYDISYPDHATCCLKIDKVTEADSGSYRATIKDTGHSKITTVEIKSSEYAPVFQEHPQSVHINQNGSLNIVCVVSCIPFAKSVTWTIKPADGSPVRNLMNNVRYKMINKPLHNTSHLQRIELYFENGTISDAGEYGVRVENSVGWNSVKIPVYFSGATQNKKSQPKFIQPLEREIICQANKSAAMKCRVTGNPAPSVKWMKNGRDLGESGRFKIIKSGDSHELIIGNVRDSDSGIYEASASNTSGRDVSKCQLRVCDSREYTDNKIVREKPITLEFSPKENRFRDDNSDIDSPQRTQMIFSNNVIRSPPQFVTTFSDEIVNVGDDVVLKCCLIGYPEPIVWWSYNTHFINNPRFEMKRELDEYFLFLKNVQKSDSGRYSITAENNSGLATCSALVIVDNNPTKRTVDRSKYPSHSKPLPKDSYPNALKLHSNDESRIMQVSPLGWQSNEKESRPTSGRSFQNDNSDSDCTPEQDIATTKTKTIKTYHYSGPSGVELPGVGFIPKIVHSRNNSPSHSSYSSSLSSSSNSQIGLAKYVPGNKTFDERTNNVLPPALCESSSRFSVVESSDCDFPL